MLDWEFWVKTKEIFVKHEISVIKRYKIGPSIFKITFLAYQILINLQKP